MNLPHGDGAVDEVLDGRPVLSSPLEVAEPEIVTSEDVDADLPWQVVVWNDPINLMSYVTFVFQKLFGYDFEKANRLMLDVHEKGRAIVSSGTRPDAEYDVHRLHSHGLWATMEKVGGDDS